jgi:hypothetical protein
MFPLRGMGGCDFNHSPDNRRCWVISGVLLNHLCCRITALCGSSIRLCGSQVEQERFDWWGGIYLVQFRIVGENRLEQSRTFLDTEVIIIHRFTCLPLTNKAEPVGFGLKRAFL